MYRVVLAEKDAANTKLEERQRVAADQLRTNSGFNTSQYSAPVLSLIFLRFEDVRYPASDTRFAQPLTLFVGPPHNWTVCKCAY